MPLLDEQLFVIGARVCAGMPRAPSADLARSASFR